MILIIIDPNNVILNIIKQSVYLMGYYEMNVKIVKDIPKNKDKYDDIAYVDYGLRPNVA